LRRQTTIRREAVCTGIGLHGGQKVSLTLRPAASGEGVRFVRSDLDGAVVPASPAHLDRCNYSTILRQGDATVGTVEHLLSALYGSGVDNVIAEVDGPELPILDGSAVPFLDLLGDAGIRELPEPRHYIEIVRPVGIVEQGKEIVVLPCDSLQLSYLIDFQHPAIGRQERTVEIEPDAYALDVAPARTFTFVREVDALREMGLAQGGSLTNAVVLDDQRLLNSTLRFEDEFVRHKLLDLLGDLALLGRPLLGHVMALKAGHELHGRLVSELLARTDAWRLVLEPGVEVPGSGAAVRSAGASGTH